MSLLRKIVITGVIAALAAVVGIGTAQATISDECRADISQCTAEELTEYIAELSATLQALQNQLAALTGEEEEAPTVAIEGCTITSFDRNLSQGMSGDDVKCLQIILNSDPDTQLAETGVGS
ncbi:hypothetical protein J7K44_00190, partial [bacterium]|nr:hypothetical protein [bacterium]